MVATIWLVVSGLLLVVLYIRVNDAKLGRIAPEAAAFSPKRWAPEEVRHAVDELASSSASLLNGQLPPKTGRRYIITGGVSIIIRLFRRCS